MPTPSEPVPSHELVELEAWYVDSLLPKLVRAASSGLVEAGAAAELDRRLRDLLDLPHPVSDVAA